MKLLAHDLASMLEFGGFTAPDATEDPDRMWKIGYLCDLINGHVERLEPTGAMNDTIDTAGAW